MMLSDGTNIWLENEQGVVFLMSRTPGGTAMVEAILRSNSIHRTIELTHGGNLKPDTP